MTTWQWKLGGDVVTVSGATPDDAVTAMRSRSLGGDQQTNEEWMADVTMRAERMGMLVGRYHNAAQFLRRMAEVGVVTTTGGV